MTVFKVGLRAVTVAVATLVIAACATQQGQQMSPAEAAAQAAATSHYKDAVQEYLKAAGEATTTQKKRHYQFEAAVAAAQNDDVDTAQSLLSQIDPKQLSKTDQSRYTLARREIKIANLSPGQALTKLPPLAANTVPEVAQHVLEKRAELYFADHDPVRGIHALVKRDKWLKDKRSIEANDNLTYDKSLDAIGLGIGPNSRAAANQGKVTRGWLALAAIGQRSFPSDKARSEALANWQHKYPNHPASRTVLTQRLHYSGPAAAAKGPAPNMKNGMAVPANGQVAIALPLSGKFKNAAGAIRDGFLFSYKNDSGNLPQPLVYDSNSMPPGEILAKAQQDNVGLLIGPLLKSKVSGMSSEPTSLPEIALNTAKTTSSPRAGFYQFGLAPENDAESAASYAVKTGYQTALALVPSGSWGDRVLDAFKQALEADGGQLIAYQTYNSSGHDHSRSIRALLQHKNGADFIFVAAQPVQARLIRSQLKYYRAGDLPMVATASAYSGVANPAEDVDLNNVHFVDIPWILGKKGTIKRLRSLAISDYDDEAKNYGRPFALGMDAWMLARRLNHDNLAIQKPVEGMTGVLSVQPDGRIKRYLGWAVFRNGNAHTLSMPSRSMAKQGDQEAQPSSDSHDNPQPSQATDDDNS